MALRKPAAGFLGVRPGVDRLTAEVDAAFEQLIAAFDPSSDVRLGHRRIGSGDKQPLRFMFAHDVDRMLDPPGASGQDDRGIGRRDIRAGGLTEGEGENDEAEGVDQQEEGDGAADHKASRNAASTAARATQVASIVRASGSKARTTKSLAPRVAPPVSWPANAAPVASRTRTIVAA